MTRRRLALWQREKRRQRIIFYGASIVAAIILILLVGWFVTEISPLAPHCHHSK